MGIGRILHKTETLTQLHIDRIAALKRHRRGAQEDDACISSIWTGPFRLIPPWSIPIL